MSDRDDLAQRLVRRLRPAAEIGLANPFGDVPFHGGGLSPGTGRAIIAQLRSGRAAPAIAKGGTEAMARKIYEHAEQVRSPDYPPAKEPVFTSSGDDVALTKALVPQRSIAGELPPMPKPGDKLPFKDRARPIVENTEAIANELVKDLSRAPDKPVDFYATGPVLQGLMDRAGLSPAEANTFMRDWAGQGAGTSPRTQTPANLRNAAYLMYRRAQGDPLTSEAWAAEGNRPGFSMMKMHTDLANDFATGTNNLWSNPKPSTFRENWSGNLADVTVDTHNIRKLLDVADRLQPGSLPREWFNSDEAFNRYREGGGFPQGGQLPVGDIRDTLGGAVVPGTGMKAQTEYPIMQAPTALAAQKLGIAPAEAHERLWFEGGERTGLRSPPMAIPDLLNSQIEATAKVLGLTPEAVLRLWAQRKIPLAENEPQNVPGAAAVG